MSRRFKQSISKAYPTELSWDCRIWTIKAGDILYDTESNQYHRVKHVQVSPVPGEAPTLEFEEIPCYELNKNAGFGLP